MSRARLALLFAATPATVAAETRTPPETTPRIESGPETAADPELLQDLLDGAGVDTTTPRPRLSHYIGDVVERVIDTFTSWLSSLGEIESLVTWALRALVVVLFLVFLGLLLRHLARTLRRPRRQNPAPRDVTPLEPAPVAVDWHGELERRLEAGDAAGALEALWWWLAARLGVAEVDAAWTTRELARRGGRGDLMPLVRRFDRLVYAGDVVDGEEVRGLWQSLRREVT